MNANKIGIDVSALDPDFKEHSTRGIGRYVRELKNYFDSNLDSRVLVDYFNHQDVLKDSVLASAIDYSPAGKQTMKQHILYPLKLNSQSLKDFNVLHFLAQMDAPSWTPKPYILSVMDIIPIVCADLYKAAVPNWRYKLARFFEIQAIKNAKMILAISETSKNDLVQHLSVDADKIFVTPLGVAETLKSEIKIEDLKNKFKLPQNREFLLYVGGIDPRKNVSGLLKSYRLVLDHYQEQNKLELAPVFLFAGRINKDREYPKFQKQLEDLDLKDFVYELGFVDDQELNALYQNCAAFCFLSLYEGFGLTPLEAMAAGAPVVSSNLSAMAEVLGDAAMLVNPNSPEEVAAAIVMLLSNNDLREEFKAVGQKHAKQYTWERTGELTLSAYHSYFHGS